MFTLTDIYRYNVHTHTHIYIYIHIYIYLFICILLRNYRITHVLYIEFFLSDSHAVHKRRHGSFCFTNYMVTWPRRLTSKVIQSRRRSVPRRHAWIWTMLKQPVTELGRYYKCLSLKFVSWEEHFASLGTHCDAFAFTRWRAQEMRFDNLTLSCR